jgi:hypothetical protein
MFICVLCTLRTKTLTINIQLHALQASASTPPLLLPIYHHGIDDVMPQDEHNRIKHSIPRVGKNLYVGRVDTHAVSHVLFMDQAVEFVPSHFQTFIRLRAAA